MHQTKLTDLPKSMRFKSFEIMCQYFIDSKQSMGKFLIPQICIDFYDWENCACMI